MIWSEWITQVADLLDIAATITNAALAAPSTDPNFNNILPAAVYTTELRIQRDLDLINTYVTDETGALTINNRKFTLPTGKGTYVVVTQVYPIISGVRQAPLLPVSLEAINAFYPSDTSLTPAPSYPVYWAPNDGVSILVGPAGDAAYGMGVVGTQRFTALSASNTSNFLTLQMPDVYLAASMQFMFEKFQRDGGTSADDPTQSSNWERTYQSLMKPALIENKRAMFQTMGWSPRLPSPAATPQQT